MKRESWEPLYDDEPRTNGKTDADLFREACEAADAKRREKAQDDLFAAETRPE